MNPLEKLGVPRMAGSTIVGYGIMVMAGIALITKQITFDQALTALGGAGMMIALPQHKASPEDADAGKGT